MQENTSKLTDYSILKLLYHYRFYILAALYVLHVLLFWPGYFVSDSQVQYSQAISGVYTDHHPPLMSFVWHYLNQIYPGIALMFVLQVTLLYSGLYVLLKTIDLMPVKNKSWLVLVLLVFPVYPQILNYSVFVFKDSQFTFSFLLVAAILAYYSLLERRPPIYILYFICFMLIYGTAVKFQAQYCLIIIAIWLGCLFNLGKKLWRKLTSALIIYTLIVYAVTGINDLLVPYKNKNYSWQYVKLYDLAAVSLAEHLDLIPAANKTAHFSTEKLEQLFEYPLIDTCVFGTEPILAITRSEEGMAKLRKQWWHVVLTQPYSYLRHRAINLSYMVLSRPGYQYVLPLVQKIPQQSFWYNIAYYGSGAVFYLFMSHLPVIILGFGYFILAIVSCRVSKVAPILLAFSSLALLMVAILFFMSMAGVPRYTYFSIVMIHASHIFAYICYRDLRYRKLLK